MQFKISHHMKVRQARILSSAFVLAALMHLNKCCKVSIQIKHF